MNQWVWLGLLTGSNSQSCICTANSSRFTKCGTWSTLHSQQAAQQVESGPSKVTPSSKPFAGSALVSASSRQLAWSQCLFAALSLCWKEGAKGIWSLSETPWSYFEFFTFLCKELPHRMESLKKQFSSVSFGQWVLEIHLPWLLYVFQTCMTN